MPKLIRVLIVEDNPHDAELIVHELTQAGYQVQCDRVCTETAFLAAIDEPRDVILADYNMPQFSGKRAIELLNKLGRDIPLLIVTGSISEEVAVECIKNGAADYLIKDRLSRLPQAVAAAVEARRLRDESRHIDSLREVMVRELNHRVKNNLSVVLSIIGQTRRSAKTYDEFLTRFTSRVRALASVHELLAANNWRGATFSSILSQTLLPFVDASMHSLEYEGEDLVIPAGAVQMLGMVIHELATNAVQHGSLSQPEGKLRVSWRTLPSENNVSERSLELSWFERGAAIHSEVASDEGFGLSLIRHGIPHELRGSAHVSFTPGEFNYRAVIPLSPRDAPPDLVAAETRKFTRAGYTGLTAARPTE